ncbi:phosphate-starvation-inducible protein PsiE [Thiomicrorhabdus aquaedulcis]|uniref:phosphate-starvation-inducible protein PsiE n=1 Tax=Thiomicrorhabdus aquaedulcis TaxID=2211106 RepID=UPI000FDB2C3C|nr:phosphate-starvation-inducible PsiE family protein [Thiomicrorhabdus aquaedulcis]
MDENQPIERRQSGGATNYQQYRKVVVRPKREIYLSKGIHYAEYVGLVIIALATLFAGYIEVMHMINARMVTLGDLLLLFLYLEVLAMVAIYLESGKLPIRLPLYIAIVALARLLILDMKEMSEWEMIAVGGTITLITIATLILRYGHINYPYNKRRRITD